MKKSKFQKLINLYYKFHYEIIALVIFTVVVTFGVLLDGINTQPSKYLDGELHSYMFVYIAIIGFAVTMPFLPTLIGTSLGIALTEFVYNDDNFYIIASFLISIVIIISIHFLKNVVKHDFILIIIGVIIFTISYLLSWGFINNFASDQINDFMINLFMQSGIILIVNLLIDQTLIFIAKQI